MPEFFSLGSIDLSDLGISSDPATLFPQPDATTPDVVSTQDPASEPQPDPQPVTQPDPEPALDLGASGGAPLPMDPTTIESHVTGFGADWALL